MTPRPPPVIGPCRLCLQSAELQHSHVLPDLMYQGIYDSKHRVNVITDDPRKKPYWEQQGIREYMLCSACENRFSKLERYAANLLFRSAPTETLEGKGQTPQGGVCRVKRIEGIDYRQFKLFQLSLLWRMDVSENSFFAAVRLGAKHSEQLRQMLLAEDPGKPWAYGCVMLRLMNIKAGGTASGLIRDPQQGRLFGHRATELAAAGYSWRWIVSSHPVPPNGQNCFVQLGGTMRILEVPAVEMDLISQILDRVNTAHPDWTTRQGK